MDMKDKTDTELGEILAEQDERDDAPYGRFSNGTPKDPNNPDHQPFPT